MDGIENELVAQIPDDFATGKVSLSDLVELLVGKFKADYQILIEKGFFYTHSPQEIIDIVQGGNIAAIAVVVVMSILVIFVLKVILKSPTRREKIPEPPKEEEEEIILRDFTLDQLREFDGKANQKIYIALKGEVFDVTNAADYYGPEGTYNCFAGRDASRAMAKLSFEETELGNPRIDDLGPFERDVLEQWVEKFKFYKQYPIVGRVSAPQRDRVFTPAELNLYRGLPRVSVQTDESLPTDLKKTGVGPERVDSEILLAVKGNVYDVSYGGKEHYGPGGSYHLFAGIDASRALAKMSFEPEDVNSSDLSDLTEEQLKILDDWEDKFQKKRLYPLVGRLVSPTAPHSSGVGKPKQ
jgi:membrane-associated progesterone receptor component